VGGWGYAGMLHAPFHPAFFSSTSPCILLTGLDYSKGTPVWGSPWASGRHTAALHPTAGCSPVTPAIRGPLSPSVSQLHCKTLFIVKLQKLPSPWCLCKQSRAVVHPSPAQMKKCMQLERKRSI